MSAIETLSRDVLSRGPLLQRVGTRYLPIYLSSRLSGALPSCRYVRPSSVKKGLVLLSPSFFLLPTKTIILETLAPAGESTDVGTSAVTLHRDGTAPLAFLPSSSRAGISRSLRLFCRTLLERFSPERRVNDLVSPENCRRTDGRTDGRTGKIKEKLPGIMRFAGRTYEERARICHAPAVSARPRVSFVLGTGAGSSALDGLWEKRSCGSSNAFESRDACPCPPIATV